LASAALIATQRLSTARRSKGKNDQEQAVEDALIEVGFEKVATRRMETLDDAPRQGQFCRESQLGRKKADLVVGVWDGRKMPLECKVSNSTTNSIKRLNDASSKAVGWLEDFGRAQTVPAAVIGGVFGLINLKAAQDSGLTLFWADNLAPLLTWL